MQRGLCRMGLIRPNETILYSDARLIPCVNISFDPDREEALPVLPGGLDEAVITWVGRFGEWGCRWTDEAFKSGDRGARSVLKRRRAAA